jgi:hypothetical protein
MLIIDAQNADDLRCRFAACFDVLLRFGIECCSAQNDVTGGLKSRFCSILRLRYSGDFPYVVSEPFKKES